MSDNGNPGSLFFFQHRASTCVNLPALPDSAELPPAADRKALRKALRKRRQCLSPQQQKRASDHLARVLNRNLKAAQARHVAVYLSGDGEIDPRTFIRKARRRGVQFYLPVLHPVHHRRLVFMPWHQGSQLKPNRFGIPEPELRATQCRPAWALDLVLMPLVGFDENGGRLGMGGGFYDRTFAFSRQRRRLCPTLIGLAHEVQKVPELAVEHWDVPLDAVATDQALYSAQSERINRKT